MLKKINDFYYRRQAKMIVEYGSKVDTTNIVLVAYIKDYIEKNINSFSSELFEFIINTYHKKVFDFTKLEFDIILSYVVRNVFDYCQKSIDLTAKEKDDLSFFFLKKCVSLKEDDTIENYLFALFLISEITLNYNLSKDSLSKLKSMYFDLYNQYKKYYDTMNIVEYADKQKMSNIESYTNKMKSI